jgi:hypothetical protein
VLRLVPFAALATLSAFCAGRATRAAIEPAGVLELRDGARATAGDRRGL